MLILLLLLLKICNRLKCKTNQQCFCSGSVNMSWSGKPTAFTHFANVFVVRDWKHLTPLETFQTTLDRLLGLFDSDKLIILWWMLQSSQSRGFSQSSGLKNYCAARTSTVKYSFINEKASLHHVMTVDLRFDAGSYHLVALHSRVSTFLAPLGT